MSVMALSAVLNPTQNEVFRISKIIIDFHRIDKKIEEFTFLNDCCVSQKFRIKNNFYNKKCF